MNQLSLAIGTEHHCTECGQTYRCDEDVCSVPQEYACPGCMRRSSAYANVAHSTWGGNRAKHDPVWAAKLARIETRMRGQDAPVQIKSAEPSPCDLEAIK